VPPWPFLCVQDVLPATAQLVRQAPPWPSPTLTRATAPIHRLGGAAEDGPCRTCARRSFSGARQPTSVAPAPVKDFQSAAPTLRALDGDKSPLVWRADAPKNGQPAAPRSGTQSAITTPPGENRHDSDHTPVHRARVHFDCAPAAQDQGKPPPRALTGRHWHGYDVAHRARHQQQEERV
jgi:hypothetical protein